MEPLVVAGALVGGSALAGVAIWAAWRATRARKPAAEAAVPLTVIEDDAPAAIARPRAPAPAVASPPPAPAPRAPARAVLSSPSPHVLPPRGHPSHAPAMVLTAGVEMRDETLAPPPPAPRAAPPPLPRAAPVPSSVPARPPMRMPPPAKSWAQQVMESTPGEVPTEWARRQVGPVEPGRTAGACGGCGARLSVSMQRPLRIACPVCGRTKLIAA